jgi:hypothetical protein
MQPLQGGRRNYFHSWTKFAFVVSLLLVFSASAAWGTDVLFVVGKEKLNGGDRAIKGRLESFGLKVNVLDDDDVDDVPWYSPDSIGLIFISKTVYSKKIGDKFAETAIPVICSEPWLFDDMGMTGPYERHDYGNGKRRYWSNKIRIIEPNHPLAAGLEGCVRVSSGRSSLGWGVPGSYAIKIASLKRSPEKFAIFAYDDDPDSIMPGFDYPIKAKRVGLFLDNNGARRLTPDGEALLDAAIEWTLGIERRHALLVTGSHWLRSGDRAIKKRLEKNGFKVTIKSDRSSKPSDAYGKDLIFLSESAYSKRVNTKFRYSEVPVICTEPYLFDDMGMTGPNARSDYGHVRRQKFIDIVDPAHPLAANLINPDVDRDGLVKVSYRSFLMGWGDPYESADVVATVKDNPGLSTIFAYETGAPMSGLNDDPEVSFAAPAPRVGLFLFRNTGRFLTADGWALFDAAVLWAMKPPTAVPEIVEFIAKRETAVAELETIDTRAVTIDTKDETIEKGEMVTLSWKTVNADTVDIDQGIGWVEANGSIQVQPDETTTYTITASSSGGTASDQVTVTVVDPSPSIELTVSPELDTSAQVLTLAATTTTPDVAFIKQGEAAVLEWSSTSADIAIITPEIGDVNLDGSLRVEPSVTTTYTLMMAGPGGTASAKAKVVVEPAAIEDYFAFDHRNYPLQNKTLTFTPNGSDNFYSVCIDDASQFPVDPTDHNIILQPSGATLGDDSSVAVDLAGNQVWLYGQAYNQFYAGSNGYLTFVAGDRDSSERFYDHFDTPRISGLFDDLRVLASSTVSWMQLADKVVVTYEDVEEYGRGNSINFQIEMYFDGVIRLTLLGIDASDGITGLSAGNGQPPGFVESDPESYMLCNEPITVCEGDFNADGTMDELDRAIFDAEFERIDCGQAEPCQADFDADGDVDEDDWEVFEIDFGRTNCPINVPLPAPDPVPVE